MAKKYTRKFKINSLLYQFGIFHSTIIHVIILLFLSIIFPSLEHKKRLKPVTIEFVSAQDVVEPDQTLFIDDIKIIEKQNEKNTPPPLKIPSENFISSGLNNLDINDIPTLEDYTENDFSILEEISKVKVNHQIDKIPSKTVAKTRRTISTTKRPHNPTLEAGTAQANNNGHVIEINKRLVEYGAKSGEVQVSLSWNTIDDLDLHVIVQPMGSHISFMNRVGICGGILDIDMNVHPRSLTNRPIENIFWNKNNTPQGVYTVGVQLYMNWSRSIETDAIVVIKVKNETKSFPVKVRFGQGIKPVTTFKYQQ